jgi:hypothetical protein
MYQISVKLIISDKGFHPSPELMASSYLYRIWREDDLVIPQATKRFNDGGVAYRILHEYRAPEWMEAVLTPLRDLSKQINRVAATVVLPAPHLSVFVETSGNDYPPLFLSRELLDMVNSMSGDVDIDIVNSLQKDAW